MNTIKYTTVGLLEDLLYSVEEVRVIFRADKNQDVVEWPYKRIVGDATPIEVFRERLNKTYPDLKYEIVDGRGITQHLRNVRMGKIRESYVAKIT